MNVVIAAGGTGGHLYPAVALAEEFRRRDPRTAVILVGTGRSLENVLLAQSDFQVETISVRGVVGRGLGASLGALLLVPAAIWKAIQLLRARDADLVIGTGGYTSPPVVIAAFVLGIRRALLEPNAVPGLANRVLGPIANRVFLSFESTMRYFAPSKTRVVGAPIRRAFVEPFPEPSSGSLKTLLVSGGSQGAHAINTAMVEAIALSPTIRENLTLIHQTGPEDYESVRAAYATTGVQAEVVPFLNDMAEALRGADLVVSRCGASTLAELAACAKPSILIPFPHATHQHQEENAKVVEGAGAAILLKQDELSGRRLAQEIEKLIESPERIRFMAERSLSLRKTGSAEAMVQECCALVAAG